MKLEIRYDSNRKEWFCMLPVDYTSWQASGESPLEAFEIYLIKVNGCAEKHEIDYKWCKERGLIW